MARWLPSCVVLALFLALIFPLRPVHADEAKEVQSTDEERLDEEEIVNRFIIWAKERGLAGVLEEDSPTKVKCDESWEFMEMLVTCRHESHLLTVAMQVVVEPPSPNQYGTSERY